MGISCDNCLHHSVVMGISCDNRLYHLKHTWKAPEESKSFHSKGRFGPINLVYPLRRFIELSVPVKWVVMHQCAKRVSGITSIRYAHNQNT